MNLFDLPVRVGATFAVDAGPMTAFTQVLDGGDIIIATTFGATFRQAQARAAWFCLHANARFAQLVPADNELDEQAYQRTKDEANDA